MFYIVFEPYICLATLTANKMKSVLRGQCAWFCFCMYVMPVSLK